MRGIDQLTRDFSVDPGMLTCANCPPTAPDLFLRLISFFEGLAGPAALEAADPPFSA